MSGKSKNLDVYLGEVFKQFVALKDNDLKKSQEVFKSVFEQVKQKMGEQCNFFSQYATQVMYAGSVYDGIKVSRLDEFDMDIVVKLPICYEPGENGITLENDQPGYIRMKITKPFDNLDKQKDWETRHKVTRDWRDADKYFLQNKFRQWIHSLVTKAINDMGGRVDVNGALYDLSYRTQGPAYTLLVRGVAGPSGDSEAFALDVDLVPVIRFLAAQRWPEGYRVLEGAQAREWLAVPKPLAGVADERVRARAWRLSFQEFERDMMKGCQQLKTTIRLVKKLRDALSMKAIASYYIKTLFLWKIHRSDRKYWETKLSVTFRSMVQELHDAIVARNIPYFWHESNNLIAGVKHTVLDLYADKLKKVLASIDANDVDNVVAYLLTPAELKEFKESKFYQTQLSLSSNSSSSTSVSRQESVMSSEVGPDQALMEIVRTLSEKIDALTDKVSLLNDRVSKLEAEKVKTPALDDLNGLTFDVAPFSSCANVTVDNLLSLH